MIDRTIRGDALCVVLSEKSRGHSSSLGLSYHRDHWIESNAWRLGGTAAWSCFKV